MSALTRKPKQKTHPKLGEVIYIGKFEHIFNHIYTDNEIKALADEMFEWFKNSRNVWLKDFAIQKMITGQRISEFEDRSDYFKQVLSLCKSKQESILVHIGLNEDSRFVRFALKNVAKWRDNPEEEKENKQFKIDVNFINKPSDIIETENDSD